MTSEFGMLLGSVGALALGGSLHCTAMCGGLAASVSSAPRWAPRLSRLGAFGIGKAVGYAVLGAVAAALTDALLLERDLAQVRAWLAVATGLVLALAGIRSARRRGEGGSGRLGLALHHLSASSLSLPGATGRFAGGLAASLLPCGLSWGAVLVASARPPHEAALAMFVFGLATLPGLSLLPLGLAALGAERLRRLAPLGGVALVLVGAWVGARGVVTLTDSPLDDFVPECCAD